MKPQKISISVFVMAITMCSTSCGPKGWFLEPTCQHYFYIENNSSKDVTISKEWLWEDIWYVDPAFVVKRETIILTESHLTNSTYNDCRPSILLCVSDTYREERFRLIVDDEVVRVWNRAEIGTGIPHHFYDDESWVLDKYQTGNDNYYTYYEWTYTITDEDITPEQR